MSIADRDNSKPPIAEAFVVQEDIDDNPRICKITILSRSDKRVSVAACSATHHRSYFDTDIFDRHFMPTREEAVKNWRRRTQEQIERNLREINRLRKMLLATPKESRR